MNRYAITEKAGRFVAGQTNTGVGTVLTLTEKQAAHELRLGTLRALDAPKTPTPTPEQKPAAMPEGKVKKATKAED
ncbi:hypothetical protein SAMN06265173_10898 [Thalassovita litoralis]|uniref:Uncharacterized protein n=1 Tax=Thalassovita litoralis TaxID=1010611 RepID=A0A521D2G9_9RHOB|nr:hypothetical protein [Thalassovita litoralis]SMO65211.1 hypothetical protein SAMN06265173_10898 [Thalassovita litoralis]